MAGRVAQVNLVVEELEEENVILTFVPIIEELNQEHLMESSVPSSAEIKNAVHLPQTNEQSKAYLKPY